MKKSLFFQIVGLLLAAVVCLELYIAVEFLATKDYFSGLLLVVSGAVTLKGAVEFGKLAYVSSS